MNIPDSIQDQLKQAQQEHLVRFWDELDESQQQALASQIENIDFDQIATTFAGDDHGDKPDWAELAARAEPPKAIQAGASDNAYSEQDARAAGEKLLSEGKVGFILVAGGQGTRLGFPHPKGMFEIGPVSNRTLFQVFIDLIRARAARYGKAIPLYLMTSPATHQETVEYLEKHDRFGLAKEDLQVFCQGTMPAVDAKTGKVLLASKFEIAISPDGHGGMLAALENRGCMADIEKRGIAHMFYGQVDSPLLQICDPALIGYHILSEAELTIQAIRKRYPLEKVGNIVSIDGRMQIIEYSDLPDEYANQTDENGNIRIWAGSIGVHVFAVSFLRRMLQSPSSLPFHLASKKVPYMDDAGNQVKPESPNATKFERFIFDSLPSAETALVVEADTAESFAPVKNAEGAETDTALIARQMMSDLHRSWLEQAGAKVADGIKVEISPFLALDPEELASKVTAGTEIEIDTFLKP